MSGLYGVLFPDSRPRCVAFVGSGGKTTVIRQLAEELALSGHTVAVAATTKMWPWTPETPGIHVYGTPTAQGKLTAPPDLAGLLESHDFLLLEADGSRGLPMKMTAGYEPVVPPAAEAVVVLMGLDGLGRPVGQVCHRWELTGLEPQEPVTAQRAASFLTACYLARFSPAVVLLNKADEENRLAGARQMSALLPGHRCVCRSRDRIFPV